MSIIVYGHVHTEPPSGIGSNTDGASMAKRAQIWSDTDQGEF